MWSVAIHLREDAESEKLKSFGEFLCRWLVEELDAGFIIPDLDQLVLDDLSAGELPQPDYLRQKVNIWRLREQLQNWPDVSSASSDEDQRNRVDRLLSRESLLREMEIGFEQTPEPSDRSIAIMVTPDVDPADGWYDRPPKEVEARIARIQSEGPSDVVERIEILVIAGDDADGFGDDDEETELWE